MDKQTHGQTEGQKYGWTDGQTEGQKDGWTDGQKDGQTFIGSLQKNFEITFRQEASFQLSIQHSNNKAEPHTQT